MILDRFRVDGQVAVVTGAGRGIGAATAVALAQAGADVVITARHADQLEKVAAQVEEAGRRAVVVPADLMDLDAVAALPGRAVDELGRLDIVVNNVGGTIPNALLDTTPEYLEEAFHFNVSTAHTLTRAAVPHLLRGVSTLRQAQDSAGSTDRAGSTGRAGSADRAGSAGRTGSVVNISSVVGRVSGRGYLAYGTAKAALAHWTRLAARDLNPHVRVNAVAVGSVMTSALEFVASDEATRTVMEDATPLRRIGEADDVAAAVLYLSSRAGGYLTGKVLEVDGGLEQPNLDLGLPDLVPDSGEGEQS